MLVEPARHRCDPVLEHVPWLPPEVGTGLSIVGDPGRRVPCASGHRPPRWFGAHPAQTADDIDDGAERGLCAAADVVNGARSFGLHRGGDEGIADVVDIDVI